MPSAHMSQLVTAAPLTFSSDCLSAYTAHTACLVKLTPSLAFMTAIAVAPHAAACLWRPMLQMLQVAVQAAAMNLLRQLTK